MGMRILSATALTGILMGCVAAPPIPQISQEMRDRIAANRPHCAEARQCEAMWAAMRDWVVKNCEMKIQTIADSFIETYNSVANKLYCRVWKDPSPGGGYDFHAEFNCNYGCVINPDAPPALLLENAVNAAAAQFAQH
jgi:hypothetical protein